jgi:hypothetical protein
MKDVGGENFGVEKEAEKSLGRGKRCVFGLSPKQLEQPHPELVHWRLLVHSSLVGVMLNGLTLLRYGVSFIGEYMPNFDLKNMVSTYTKDFS